MQKYEEIKVPRKSNIAVEIYRHAPNNQIAHLCFIEFAKNLLKKIHESIILHLHWLGLEQRDLVAFGVYE